MCCCRTAWETKAFNAQLIVHWWVYNFLRSYSSDDPKIIFIVQHPTKENNLNPYALQDYSHREQPNTHSVLSLVVKAHLSRISNNNNQRKLLRISISAKLDARVISL